MKCEEKEALMSPPGAQPPLLQVSQQPPPFPSPPKAFPLRTFKWCFNTALSTIWKHQFTSIGNNKALSCLVWLWSNWEFNEESLGLKRLGVNLIFSCPNFYWGVVDTVHMHRPAFLLPLAVIMGDLMSLFRKFIHFGEGRHPLLPTHKIGTSDDHDQSQERQGNILEQTCEALWNWRDLWKQSTSIMTILMTWQ